MRAQYKYLMIFLSAALIWAQSATAMHDQLHQHVTDDCVMCKVVENGNDKAHDVKDEATYQKTITSSVHVLNEQITHIKIWVKSSSRAPPAA
ncbi:MAG: hypothetical protein P8H03_10220 [Emcibacteraceae bacterium]|nr:hypothetical protein [Emcibacteraceae bacterium]